MAFVFNGTEHFMMGPTTSFNPGTGDFSISTWVYSSASTTQYAISKQPATLASTAVGWKFGISSALGTGVSFAMADGINNTRLNSGENAIMRGGKEWYHFAMLIDRSARTMEMYFNGSLLVQSSSITATGSILNSGSLLFGANQGDYISKFGGKLSEFYYWNSLITPQDVYTLYSSKVKGIGLQIQPQSLQCYLPMDEITEISSSGGSTASFETVGYRDRTVGSAPDFGATTEPITGKPHRPMFIYNNKTFMADWDGSGAWKIFEYIPTGYFRSAMSGSSVITTTASVRMDAAVTESNGVGMVFFTAACTSSNQLFKCIYTADGWKLSGSRHITGSMLVTENPNPGGGADCRNLPNTVTLVDSVGRVWQVFHTQDNLTTADSGSVRFCCYDMDTLQLKTDASVASENDYPITLANVHGDDMITDVTFRSGSANYIGIGYSKHSTVVPSWGGHWFVVHPDVNNINVWESPEEVQDTTTDASDDHYSITADSSGSIYAVWKTSLDATGPIHKFRFRKTGSWSGTYGLFGATVTYTRPHVAVASDKLFIVTTDTSATNIIALSSSLTNISWSAPYTVVDAAVSVNDVTVPKQQATATSRLVCACEGSNDVRFFGILYGNPPEPPTAVTKSVVNRVSGFALTASVNMRGEAERLLSYW